MNFRIPSEVRIQKARTTLLLDHLFFGTLLFRLGARPSNSLATMATDGVSLFYNSAFVDTLNAAELAGVLAHKVMHPALQHQTRRGDRNPARWNIACDYAINPLLVDAGLSLPEPTTAGKRRTDEETSTQEPFGGVQGKGGGAAIRNEETLAELA